MKVELQLFGAFRKYGSEIELDIPDGGSISEVKSELERVLGGNSSQLINISRFATNTAMIEDSYELNDGVNKLAILPPVSGG